jgi:hypothetical protein
VPQHLSQAPGQQQEAAEVSMYALTTQASEVDEKPSACRIDGRATFTTVVSTTIIRSPTQRITSAIQRVRLLRWSVIGFPWLECDNPMTNGRARIHRSPALSESVRP